MPSIALLLSPCALLVGLLVWGVLPGTAIRAIVRIYPKGHARRRELVAEVYAVRMWERPFWVASQLELGLVEGVRLRRSEASRAKEQPLPESGPGIAPLPLGQALGSGPLVISLTENVATTSTVAALNDLLIRHAGGNDVRLKLVRGETARMFEIPYPVEVSADLYGELHALLGPNCLARA